jgi:hypothetical protein
MDVCLYHVTTESSMSFGIGFLVKIFQLNEILVEDMSTIFSLQFSADMFP